MTVRSIPQRQRVLQALLFAVLAVLAFVSVAGGFIAAQSHSQDMQWSPLVVFWRDGLDPYRDYMAAPHSGRFILSQAPNYLHPVFFVLAPLAWLSFPAAKLVWAGVNVVCLGLIVWLLRSDPDASAPWTILLMFLACTPVSITLENGQFAVFCLMLFLAYLRLSERRPALAGLLASIGAVKFTLGAPMAFHMRLKPAMVAAFLALPALAVLFWSFHFHMSPLQALLLPVQVTGADIGDRDGVGDLRMILAGLGASREISEGLVLAVLVAVGLLQRRYLAGADRLTLFAFYGVLSLGLVYHRIYDFVFLLPAAMVAYRSPALWVRFGLAASVGFFWFGYQTLIELGAPRAPVLCALILAAALGLIVWECRRQMAEAVTP